MTGPQSILVLGAGELGTAVLEALVKHPKHQADSIAVLVRESSINSSDAQKRKKNDAIRSLGVSFQPGDVVGSSISELAVIFTRYDVIISCTGMSLPAGTQLKLTRAVLQGGVKRYFPWQWGLDYDAIGAGSAQDLFDEQLTVRELLRSSSSSSSSPPPPPGVSRSDRRPGTDWIIVSTGLFTSFLFVPEFGPVDLGRKTLRALGSWENRVTLTAPVDIGRVAAELVYDPREISRQVVFVAGDTVSYGQVASLVEKRFGPAQQWKRESWDVELLKTRLQDKQNDVMVKYQNVFAAGRGCAWGKELTVNESRGMEMQDLQKYLAEMEV